MITLSIVIAFLVGSVVGDLLSKFLFPRIGKMWFAYTTRRQDRLRRKYSVVSVPQFINGPRCAGCGRVIDDEEPTKVDALIPLAQNKSIPVTLNFCGVCVESA